MTDVRRAVTGCSIGVGERWGRDVSFMLACGHSVAMAEPHEMPRDLVCPVCTAQASLAGAADLSDIRRREDDWVRR